VSKVTLEDVVSNVLEEAIHLCKLRAEFFILAIRRCSRRLFDLSRSMANNELLLLAFSFDGFRAPFEEYYNRLFRKKFKEIEFRKKLIGSGLSEGGAVIVTTVVNELSIMDVIEVEGGIDEETINKKVGKRLEALGDEKQLAFKEIVRIGEIVLTDISKKGSEELIKICENLITCLKNGGIKAVRDKLDEYIVIFDSKLRMEFGVM
jgi:hypothetical protein